MDSGKLIARETLGPDNDFHIRRLAQLAQLDPDDIDQLRKAVFTSRTMRGGQEIPVGDNPVILVSGWAYRTRVLSDGRRQVFGHLLPGDVLVRNAGEKRSSGSVIITQVPTTVIDAPTSIGGFDCSSLSDAYRQAILADTRYSQHQIMRLGRLTALERLVHLFLEFGERLEAIGAGTAARFPLPVSQEILADTLGLTKVHINRTLQALRRDKILVWDGGYADLTNPDRLAARVHFEKLRPSRPSTTLPFFVRPPAQFALAC